MYKCNLHDMRLAWYESKLWVKNQDWNIRKYGEQMPGVQIMSKIVFPKSKIWLSFYFPIFPMKRKCGHIDGRIIADDNKLGGVWNMKNGSH